ncbi:uncharacterized protein LOC114931164 [Nylanderia fulva]|uniref:uncharacterized protein LOC114931164 n=1 Tax=Nylanderia fulva TaxID=613905 RepID=UPI0010FB1E2D|nr:uncharacterized protein LOC114931164 [Nylanderia fulva]
MSLEVGLLRMQNDLYGRIARAYENLRKLGTANITVDSVETRIGTIDSNWQKLKKQHDTLMLSHLETLKTHEYLKKDFIAVMEEAYVQQRAKLMETLRTLKNGSENREGATTATTARRTTLPRIQIKTFSGHVQDWPAFRDLFSSVVIKDPSLTDVERFYYLRSSLQGEAEETVQNLTITGENFGRAWKALTEHYENKRHLVRVCFTLFLTLTKMKGESAQELQRLYHRISNTLSQLETIGRSITNCSDLFVILVEKILDTRSRRDWEESRENSTELPSVEELQAFLKRRAATLKALSPVKSESHPTKVDSGSAKTARAHHTQKENTRSGQCPLCPRSHYIMQCDEYRRKTAQERKSFIEDKKLCLNCLGKHAVTACTGKRTCTACGSKHHTTLHDAYSTAAGVSTTNDVSAKTVAHTSHSTKASNQAVLLATARTLVDDVHGEHQAVRALIDPASEVSIVTEAVAQRLRLPRLPFAVTIYGVGGQRTGKAKGKVMITVRSRTSNFSLEVKALILPQLTARASRVDAETITWPHLQGIRLADSTFLEGDPIELLLGADVYASIMKQGMRKGAPSQPLAQQTTFEWILSGVVCAVGNSDSATTLQCTVGEDLNTVVRRFWEQEELPEPSRILSREEQQCEEIFVRTHQCGADGRYLVRLPVVGSLPDFASSHRVALRCLNHMEKRFQRDPTLQEQYQGFMREYESLGHMIPAEPLVEGQRGCFLPHHEVLKASSTTTKLRVVFNGSSPGANGDTLNRHLSVGANLLPAISDILTRWRRHK